MQINWPSATIDPAHPAALDFYRVYDPQKAENQKLLTMLRRVENGSTGQLHKEGPSC